MPLFYLATFCQWNSRLIISFLSLQDREPFVVVLLDGDGMIFNDELLQQGEQGGRTAAMQLSTALQDYVGSSFPGIASPKIMTKIYTNMKGLSDMCIRGGLLNEQTLLDDFIRGFNESIPLFDMVDVGPGKDRPCHKIGGGLNFISLSWYLENLCCPITSPSSQQSSQSRDFHCSSGAD